MKTLRIVLALGALTLVQCGDQDESLDRAPDLLQPLALDSTLVFVDKAASTALLLDVDEEPLPTETVRVDLPHAPRTLVRRNDQDEALVLCAGRRADKKHDEEPGALVALRSDGETRDYTLGNPFDQLTQSADGRYALLYRSAGSTDRLLDNPNEIAIIDLDKKPKDAGAITLRTLRSFGDSPDGVVFSPPMTIAGEERRLAVVLSSTNVTLLDLSHLERRETTVQLAGRSSTQITPRQVVFNPGAPEIYLRGDGSADVFVFNLSPRAEGTAEDEDGPHNDFRPFIDQLGVGGAPSDMGLYEDVMGARLLVLSDPGVASLVVPATSQVTSVELPVSAKQLLLFEATSPRDDELGPRALLYSPGATSVMFLDLADLEERGSRNLEVLPLGHSIERLVPMLEEGRVLVIHEGNDVSLIDLASRTAPPITSSVKLQSALFDPENRRLWVGPESQPYLGWFDLDTGDTREVLLDHDIATVVPFFTTGRIAVVHRSDLGLLTVLDSRMPSRDSARSTRGFFAGGLLDRGESQ